MITIELCFLEPHSLRTYYMALQLHITYSNASSSLLLTTWVSERDFRLYAARHTIPRLICCRLHLRNFQFTRELTNLKRMFCRIVFQEPVPWTHCGLARVLMSRLISGCPSSDTLVINNQLLKNLHLCSSNWKTQLNKSAQAFIFRRPGTCTYTCHTSAQ